MTDTIMTARAADPDETSDGHRPAPARWLIAGAAALVALVLAMGILTMTREENGQAISVPAADSANAGFARDMAVHHQQAVEMAYIIRDRTTDEDVRRLAYDIAQTQANQRGMLLGWLDLWGLPKISTDGYMAWMKGEGHDGHETTSGALMPGMATRTDIGQLSKGRGEEAEILFLQLMTEHHAGGVTMARACAKQCTVPQERALARGMVDAQQSEIALMTDMLKERGSAPR
ncbi:DUF305 domain-containing protein (plasmid) [Streptomyces sp. G6]|uniref:DUF305 domain-containing protein n=1 Tax=Streptomyces sp. G6 TaxID=1178736 RepID=UPI003ED9FC62